jgi:hypothetical protein
VISAALPSKSRRCAISRSYSGSHEKSGQLIEDTRSTLAVPEGNTQRGGSNSFLRGNQTGISEKREDNAHVAE